MNEVLTIEMALAFAAGLLIGAAAVWIVLERTKSALRGAYGEALLGAQRELIETKAALQNELIAAQAALAHEQTMAHEKIKTLQETKEQLKRDFGEIAAQIYEEKEKRFALENEKQLNSFLKPFKDQVEKFEKSVSEKYETEGKERFSLKREIEQLKTLNEQLSTDAKNLTGALKGQSKTQGIWGEMILERLLEDSGLSSPREYETQKSFSGDEGRKQPDAIVHLPEERDLVIDSKVSLVAYERYQSAQTQEARNDALKALSASVRTHINSLSKKDYEHIKGIRSLDFVVIFVPIEGAYLLSMQSDPSLFKNAYDKGVLLSGPSTLMLILRIVENIWKKEDQNKNAELIAQKAGALLDKFTTFYEYLERVGTMITRTQSAYNDANNALNTGNGNLIGRVKELEKLGAKGKKQLPAISKEISEQVISEPMISEHNAPIE